MKIILKGYIDVPQTELEATKKELILHTKLSRAEPGCIVFSVEQNKQEPTKFDVYEEFATPADFEIHQQRVKSSSWGKFSQNFKRSYQMTRV